MSKKGKVNPNNIQDWTQVVLNKNKNEKSKVPQIQKQPSAIKTDTEGEIKKIKKVTSEMGKKLTTARVSKNLTQEQLAQKACLSGRIIKEVERGGCLYNHVVINKMCNVLGISVRRDL